MPWVNLKYKDLKEGRIVGITAHCQTRSHFQEILTRFDILPDHIELLEFDGVPFDPSKLTK